MEQQSQENLTRGKGVYRFGAFPLYEHKTPDFKEALGYPYVRYGDDNAYPDYLIYLYNRCAAHNAIVNAKVRFIIGRGWQPVDGKLDSVLAEKIKRVNPKESLNEFTKKCALDNAIFGGYAVRVVWFSGKISGVYHQPFQEIRTNVDKSIFFHSKEWTRRQSTKARFMAHAKLPSDVKEIKPFNPSDPTGEQLLYICEYRPQQNIYPLPEYIAANAAIETDIEIDNFHLNNIKSGFAAGTMITLFNGKPDDDVFAETERKLKEKFSGTDNAGETIINFAELDEKEPLITNLRPNDLDKQYDQLAKSTIEKIFIGHNVTSPMLFGVKTEGQLGGRSELDVAWKLMQLNYTDPKQRKLESDINYLLKFMGAQNPLELAPLKSLGMELSEATIVQTISKNDLLELINEQLGTQFKPSETPIPAKMDKTELSKDEFESILINRFSKLGVHEGEFEFVGESLSEDEQILLDYLKGKKKVDLEKAAKELKIDAVKVIQSLIEKNIVQGALKGNNVEVKDIQEPQKPDGVAVTTMWKYSGPKDEKNRDFCAKMLELNRLYTREEIDQLNNDMKGFNKDVWLYRGGWYTVPETDGLLHVPSCRHTWNQVIVRKKI